MLSVYLSYNDKDFSQSLDCRPFIYKTERIRIVVQ